MSKPKPTKSTIQFLWLDLLREEPDKSTAWLLQMACDRLQISEGEVFDALEPLSSKINTCNDPPTGG